MEKRIEKFLKKHYKQYLKVLKNRLKGLGIYTIGALIAEIGDIKKFANDGKLAAYAGQAPRNFQSASMRKSGIYKYYNRFLAKIIHMIALNNIKEKGIFYDYYQMKIKRFSKKLRALKSVKRIICKIIFELFMEVENYSKNNVVA